jgi:translation elongation factor P/translation initiation factor 5A
MLEYSEIKEKKVIIYEGEPCEVTESHVARTQQRKPQNQVKMRSLDVRYGLSQQYFTHQTPQKKQTFQKKKSNFSISNKE